MLRLGPGALRKLGPLALSACLPAATLAPLGCAQVDETALGDGSHSVGKPVVTGPSLDLATPPDMASTSPDASGPVIESCGVHKLRINELQTGGSAGATDEFIELYNPCDAQVALQGARIVYRASTSGGDNFTFYAFTTEVVPPHGYFVVANGAFPGAADCKPFQTGGGMAAAGGGIGLKDPLDAVIDSVGWGTAVNAFVEGHVPAAPSPGQSLARNTDGVDTNDNVADFTLTTPSPGASN